MKPLRPIPDGISQRIVPTLREALNHLGDCPAHVISRIENLITILDGPFHPHARFLESAFYPEDRAEVSRILNDAVTDMKALPDGCAIRDAMDEQVHLLNSLPGAEQYRPRPTERGGISFTPKAWPLPMPPQPRPGGPPPASVPPDLVGRFQEFPTPEQAVLAFVFEVTEEVAAARKKFPSPSLLTLALAEESGEAIKAALDLMQAKGGATRAQVRKECVQTAAMACRLATEGDPAVFGEGLT